MTAVLGGCVILLFLVSTVSCEVFLQETLGIGNLPYPSSRENLLEAVHTEASQLLRQGNEKVAHHAWVEALELYRTCLQTFPCYGCLYNIGIVYASLGRKQDARRCMATANYVNGSGIGRVEEYTFREPPDEAVPFAPLLYRMFLIATPDYLERYWMGVNSKQCYALRHGYHLHIDINRFRTGREVHWNRVIVARKLLPHVEWLFYGDVDQVITNTSITLETFVNYAEERGCDLLLQDGDADHSINSGAFFLRNTQWASWFLDRWWQEGHRSALAYQDQGPLNMVLLQLVSDTHRKHAVTDVRYEDDCSGLPMLQQSRCWAWWMQRLGHPFGQRNIPHVCFWDSRWPVRGFNLFEPMSSDMSGMGIGSNYDRHVAWMPGDFLLHGNSEALLASQARIAEFHHCIISTRTTVNVGVGRIVPSSLAETLTDGGPAPEEIVFQLATESQLEREKRFLMGDRANWTEVVERLETLATLAPSAGVHNSLGFAYFRLGKEEHAEASFRVAFRMNRWDVTVTGNLERTQVLRGTGEGTGDELLLPGLIEQAEDVVEAHEEWRQARRDIEESTTRVEGVARAHAVLRSVLQQCVMRLLGATGHTLTDKDVLLHGVLPDQGQESEDAEKLLWIGHRVASHHSRDVLSSMAYGLLPLALLVADPNVHVSIVDTWNRRSSVLAYAVLHHMFGHRVSRFSGFSESVAPVVVWGAEMPALTSRHMATLLEGVRGLGSVVGAVWLDFRDRDGSLCCDGSTLLGGASWRCHTARGSWILCMQDSVER